MEQARAKVFTKHISAVVTPEDYEILKRTSELHKISIGDVLRGLIRERKTELEDVIKEDKRKIKQQKLF